MDFLLLAGLLGWVYHSLSSKYNYMPPADRPRSHVYSSDVIFLLPLSPTVFRATRPPLATVTATEYNYTFFDLAAQVTAALELYSL